MQKIYIVLTYTGTVLSRIVNFYTRRKYAHVSISLDKDLSHMYSFARLNPYNPFIGGFVQESPKFGTFKRFSKTKTKIYSIEVDDDQYKRLKSIIEDINLNKGSYHFNILGLFAVAFNLKVKREKYFYCAEFVKYVLESSNLNLELPNIVKPDDFRQLDGLSEIYTGKLNQYNM